MSFHFWFFDFNPQTIVNAFSAQFARRIQLAIENDWRKKYSLLLIQSNAYCSIDLLVDQQPAGSMMAACEYHFRLFYVGCSKMARPCLLIGAKWGEWSNRCAVAFRIVCSRKIERKKKKVATAFRTWTVKLVKICILAIP